ncbi:MAG TPA: hypothetical protein VME43_13955 [Bryobacteraceae bacterium]|nr:hypothetical protein [Bryobacteraceae bacterium]
MRKRSLSGPILLLAIGAFFLWRNMHPEMPIFDLVSQYWPLALVAWGVLRLVEVLAWRNRGLTGLTGGEVVLIVLICIAGSGLWTAHEHGVHFTAGSLDVFGQEFDYPLSAQAPAAGMTRVAFDNPRGNIKVTGGDTEDVIVNGHKGIRAWSRTDADRSNGITPIEIVPQGDRLLIRSNQDHIPNNQSISDDLEVTIPRNMSVESHGRTGDYEVTDVTGELDLATEHGDVRLDRIGGDVRLDIGRSDLVRAGGVGGKVELQGRGSDLEFEDIQGPVTVNGSYDGTLTFKNLSKPLQFEGARSTEVHAEAIPGTLTMDLSQLTGTGLTGPLRMTTGSRDVKLQQFTKSLELETVRGDIELDPGKAPLPSIDARSSVGRIDLVLPQGAAFDLEATAERGQAENDYGPSITREDVGRGAVLRGRVGDGPSIRLTAARGTVAVRKPGDTDTDTDTDDSPDSKPPTPPKPPAPPKTQIKL